MFFLRVSAAHNEMAQPDLMGSSRLPGSLIRSYSGLAPSFPAGFLVHHGSTWFDKRSTETFDELSRVAHAEVSPSGPRACRGAPNVLDAG